MLHGSEERVAALKQGCSTDGWGGLPRCELGSLSMAATQLIDDMEDKQAVPDRSDALLHPGQLHRQQKPCHKVKVDEMVMLQYGVAAASSCP